MRRHSFKHSLGALFIVLSLCLGYTLAIPTQGSRDPVPLTIRSVDGPVRKNGYIITFKPTADAQEAQDRIVQQFGRSAVRHRYNTTNLDGLAGTFNATQIATLKASSFIESIELDTVGQVDSLVVQKDANWALQRLSQLGPVSGGSKDLNYTYSYDSSGGSGTDIYIVDSGINIQHADFGGRATWGMTFGNYTPDVDGLGHGTHVAGIAAGTRFGVAKNANLIAVRIISATGTGYSSDCIAAVNWIINQAKSTGLPSVINISVKFPPNDLLDAVVTDAVNNGVHVVVSAGNAASDASSQSPARASAATTVGATDITDSMAFYSNFGPLVDIYAPGTDITSDYITSNTATKSDTGTSMASPFVAGLTAYYIGLFGNKAPSDILNLIKAVSPYNKLSSIPADTVNQIIDNGAYFLPGYQQGRSIDDVTRSTVDPSSTVYSSTQSSSVYSSGGPTDLGSTISSSSTALPIITSSSTIESSSSDAVDLSTTLPKSETVDSSSSSTIDYSSSSVDSSTTVSSSSTVPQSSEVYSSSSIKSSSSVPTPSITLTSNNTVQQTTVSMNSTVLATSTISPCNAVSASSTVRLPAAASTTSIISSTTRKSTTSSSSTRTSSLTSQTSRPTSSTPVYEHNPKWCFFFWWC